MPEVLSVKQIAAVIDCPEARALIWYTPINLALQKYEITTRLRQAAFLSQIAHESGKLRSVVENLNYSAVGLAGTWPSRYAVDPKARKKQPNELALRLHRKPEQIANHTYANRMENGPPESGDGWKYRGRGPKQCTGARNYRLYQEFSTRPVLKNPDLLLDPEIGMDVAGWFWDTNNCGPMADRGDIKGVTIAINGGLIGYEDGNDFGLDDRVELYQNGLMVLA